MRAIETPQGQANYHRRRFNQAHKELLADPQYKALSADFRTKMREILNLARGLAEYDSIDVRGIFWYIACQVLFTLKEKVLAEPFNEDKYKCDKSSYEDGWGDWIPHVEAECFWCSKKYKARLKKTIAEMKLDRVAQIKQYQAEFLEDLEDRMMPAVGRLNRDINKFKLGAMPVRM